jgi:hypothetical protein
MGYLELVSNVSIDVVQQNQGSVKQNKAENITVIAPGKMNVFEIAKIAGSRRPKSNGSAPDATSFSAKFATGDNVIAKYDEGLEGMQQLYKTIRYVLCT